MAISPSANECLDWFCAPPPRNDGRFSVMLVAAHPDDEVIGAGAQLPRLPRLTILHLTDGAPENMRDGWNAGCATRHEYAAIRHQEALSALALAGIWGDQLAALAVPDQQASRNLVAISQAIARMLTDLEPDIVVTHPYEAGHPDHDATAFCVHSAVALVRRVCQYAPKGILEFTSYHARGWELESGRFLENGGPVKTVRLSPEEQDLKRAMMARHATQSGVLEAFSVTTESFRLAPEYDFMRLPATSAYYDRFDWGLKSPDWPPLVRDAINELGSLGTRDGIVPADIGASEES